MEGFWRFLCSAICVAVLCQDQLGSAASRVSLLNSHKSQQAANVTFLLNNLLHHYDNSLRPDIGGPPLRVEINMQVRSMGPISEIDMSYSMDCYFRQTWIDRRLAFSGQKNLALSIEMLRKIWKPDTYIFNGRRSYLHTITTPNKFMRLFPNGRVLYSQRLTIRASCHMDLSDFPMDKQRCPLIIGSFGYTDKDVLYEWTSGRGVNIASDMKLSQFDLISAPTGNSTETLNQGRHSTLLASFHLQRHMGNFVIQVYGPCVLLVVISWVSFWLNREATSDRISLGVTTVLTMTFLGLEARTDLPQVAYPTALDYFVFFSFIFIFATVVQFALVHYFTKLGAGEYYLEELEETLCTLEIKRKRILERALRQNSSTEDDEEKMELSSGDEISYIGGAGTGTSFGGGDYLSGDGDDDSADGITMGIGRNRNIYCLQHNHVGGGVGGVTHTHHQTMYSSYSTQTLPQLQQQDQQAPPKERNYLNHHPYGTFFYNKKTGRCGRKTNGSTTNGRANNKTELGLRHAQSFPMYAPGRSSGLSREDDDDEYEDEVEEGEEGKEEKHKCECKRCITRAMNNPEKALNSVSKIDKISRVVFPMTFTSLNIFYWYSYLKHSERIDLYFEE